jgi:hypothetical protein
MNALRKSLVVGSMTLALVGAGAGAAWAGTPNPAPVGQLGRIAQPAQFPWRPAPPVTVNGEVVAANGRSLTVRGTDGRTTVFQLAPNTQISKGGRRAGAGQLMRRDRVQVTANRVGNTLNAIRIVDDSR